MPAAHSTPERQHYNITLAILTIAGIAFALQQTMVVPALPALQRELHTTTTWATWILTGFLLVASVATPLLGKLGDQHGKERLLVISLGVFFLGSVFAALAWNIWSLIGARCIQGIGGAVFPLSFAIIKDEFPAEKVGTAVGVVSSVFAVGGALGLTISGVIVDNASWRWLFVVGAIPVGVSVLLVHRFVPESPIKTPSRVDVPGAILLSLGLVSFLLGMTEAENWGWTSGRILGLFAAAVVFVAAWVRVELRVDQPMIDMRMFVRRPVLLTNVTGVIAGFSMFASFIIVPQFVEMPRGLPDSLAQLVPYGFGASATMTGLYLLPGSLAGFVGGPLAGLIGRRLHPKVPLAIGMAIASVGIAILALWHDRPWQVIVGMTVMGSGLPMTFAAMAKLIVDSVRPTETAVAGGMNTVMRTIGGVVGGQVVAAILTAETIKGTPIPTEGAFETAFWLGSGGALAAAIVALFVTPRRRARRA